MATCIAVTFIVVVGVWDVAKVRPTSCAASIAKCRRNVAGAVLEDMSHPPKVGCERGKLNFCCGQSVLEWSCELLELYSTHPTCTKQHQSCCLSTDCCAAPIDDCTLACAFEACNELSLIHI